MVKSEVCSQIGAGHTHLEEWGGKGDGTCTVGSWGRQARTQVNRCRHLSRTAIATYLHAGWA